MKTEKIQFTGINTRDGSKSLPKAFEADYDIPYPSLYDPWGKIILSRFPKGTVVLQCLPTTIILDRSGKIAAREFGGIDDVKMHKMIDPLLKES